MKRAAATLIVVLVAINGCGAEEDPEAIPDPLTRSIDAAEKTLAAGPSALSVSATTPGGAYLIRGSLDPRAGYRFCGLIKRSPEKFQRDLNFWIEGRRGVYDTLIELRGFGRPSGARTRTCRQARWLDDHPPTLSLHGDVALLIKAPYNGLEDHLHAILVAFSNLEAAAIAASETHACASGTCYRVTIDFERFDRRRTRDEDLWTLRPFLRSLGRHPIDIRIDDLGMIDRVRLSTPSRSGPDQTPSAVTVLIRLSDFGQAAQVRRATMTAIE